MKKVLLIVFIVVVVAAIGAHLYISQIFLPKQLKEIISNKLQQSLGRKITYDTVDYHFPQSLEIRNLTVYEKESENIFVRVPRVSLTVLLTINLAQRTVLIPSITIDSPEVNIEKQTPESWNFSDLIELKKNRTKGTTSSSSPVQLIVKKITIQNGRLKYTNSSVEPVFNEELKNISAQADIHIDRTLDFKCSLDIPRLSSDIKADGKFHITDKNLQANLKAKNIALAQYLQQFLTIKTLDIKDGHLPQADLRLDFAPQNLHIQGSLSLTKASVQFTAAEGKETFQSFEGSADLESFSLEKKGQSIKAHGRVKARETRVNLSGKTMAGSLQVNLKSLNFDDGVIAAQGEALSDNFTLTLPGEKTIQGQAKISNVYFSKNNDALSLKADTHLTKGKIVLSPSQIFQGDFKILRAQLNRKNQELQITGDVDVQNSDFTFNDRSLTGDILAPKLNLGLSYPLLKVSGNLQLTNGRIKLDDEKTIVGSPDVTFKLSTDMTNPKELTYAGIVSVQNAGISGLPIVKNVEQLSGDVVFENDQVKTDKITFHALATDMTIQGNLINFKNPHVNINLSGADVDFKNILPNLPEDMVKKIPGTIDGRAGLKIAIDGKITELSKAKITAHADLKKVSVTTPKLPFPVTDITGQASYADNFVFWKDLELTYLDRQYKSTGKIVNFKEPNITAAVTSDQLSVNADITTKDKLLTINKLNAAFLDSTIEAAGNIGQFGTPESKIDVRASSSINLLNLKEIPFPSLAEKIKKLNLSGKINLDADIQGEGQNFRIWDIDLKVTSPLVTYAGTPIEDIQLAYHQTAGLIDLLEITALVYDGAFKIQSKGIIKEPDIPMEYSVELNRMNLETLRKRRELKLSNLQGMLTLDMYLKGPLLKPLDIQGTGNLIISEGIIWEFDILKGIFGALLIPEFQNIIFTDAQADFEIKEQKVYTQNAELISKSVNLLAKGWVSFDQTLSMEINPTFSEISILQSDSLKKAPTNLLTQSIAIGVSGTLKEPKFRADTSVKKVIENTTGIITDTIKGVLEEVF